MLADNVTRCAICRRTLLVGEAADIYQDARTHAIQPVCRLCTVRADRAGWEHRGEQHVYRTSRLRAAPAPVPAADRRPDRLVRRLHAELERLGEELEDAADAEDGDEDAAAAREAAREAEMTARVRDAEARLGALEEALRGRDRKIRELERSVHEAHAAQEMLLRARRREADPAYLSGIACEVFNRSAQRAEVVDVARRCGEPLVRVQPDGLSLPRGVLLTFEWGEDRYRYRVSCDLVARLFDVEDLSHGPVRVSGAPLQPNARLTNGRVALDL